MAASIASAAAPQTLPLTVTIKGTGNVTVTGHPRLFCKTTCTKTLQIPAGAKVTLTPHPTTLWKLAPWTPPCAAAVPACKLTVTRAATVAVTFLAPGTQANPIQVGHAWPVRDGWRMKVGSVTANANAQVLAAANNASFAQVPPGAQDFMVSISATYTGGGSGDLSTGLVGLVETVGAHNAIYDTNTTPCPGSAWPSPSLQNTEQQVFSGQSVTGNVCYLIAANDAASLVMFVYSGANDQNRIWFALR